MLKQPKYVLASRYTGKERDAESGLDYFGARYYASNIGRFMSPDWVAEAEPIPYARLNNPQSLNLYAYAQGNAETLADNDGHDVMAIPGSNPVQAQQYALAMGLSQFSIISSADLAKQQAKPSSTNTTTPPAAARQNGNDKTVEAAGTAGKTAWHDARAAKTWTQLADRDKAILNNPDNYNSDLTVDIDFIKARYTYEFAKAAEFWIRLGEDFLFSASGASGDPETVVGRLANYGISEAKYGTDLAKTGYKASFSAQVAVTEKAYIEAAREHAIGVSKGWWPQ